MIFTLFSLDKIKILIYHLDKSYLRLWYSLYKIRILSEKVEVLEMLLKKLLLKRLYSRKIVPFEIPGTARELTEEEKLLVNGGKTIGNSIAEQAEAEEGDILIDDNGNEHELGKGDIQWAKDEMAKRTPSASGGSSGGSSGSGSGSGSSGGSSGSSGGNASSPNSTTPVKRDSTPEKESSTILENIARYRAMAGNSQINNKTVNEKIISGKGVTGHIVEGNVIETNPQCNSSTFKEKVAGYTAKADRDAIGKRTRGFPSTTENYLDTHKKKEQTQLYKQRDLEIKYDYPYGAPEYGSLCLATSIINLYVKEYSISPESVDKVMSEAKGKYISENGTVSDMASFSKRLAEECNSDRYFDYVYYNPETKAYEGAPREFTKNEFLESKYDYAIGGYYHEGATAPSTFSSVSHYEMIQKTPYMENNPGVGQYELYKIRPVGSYKM